MNIKPLTNGNNSGQKQTQARRRCECNVLLQDLLLFEKQWSYLFISMNAESPLSMQEMSEAQIAVVQISAYIIFE